ncbi:FAD/NAD(P)-binding domain-containing protein [Aaosphaeria arxii CBS 175.79]|uniref:FAD/NAD(P)-binding domain-containing protein n=1 Tax=Aaosphaeria arxii CBS 175.79 TaxID=1450172 RepID=A0A6A5X773_9PLEO|nr:FAD/NAD(P)-binding domain-containing protein [Aaosphaeria arxii CBS 175.79]KAF2008783.1 FAD/NAD(P)-binding domain-containing protein [Aaosphaeria arxii CBS 175.79]
MSLKIIIVGAGLGGLAAAISIKLEKPEHDVLVIESAPELAEVGAGLQVTPNATRLLIRWGLGNILKDLSSSPEEFTIHRYSDGKILGKREGYGKEMVEKYKSPFWDMHRADLQLALYDRATDLGVKFRFGALVTNIDARIPSATLANGENIHGDLIVGADGLWSKCRESLWGKAHSPIPTGDLAYRVILQVQDIEDDALRHFFETPRVALWAGPDCHVICYPVKANKLLNLVLLVPDNLPEGVSRVPGDIGEMLQIFQDWDPRLRDLLSMVQKVDKWKLMHMEELERWSNSEATVVFLGDACHPMLPYLAQGAGSSLEDGAALGSLLSRATSREDLFKTLQIYENLRKSRSSSLQKGSMRQRQYNHLPDGSEQQHRDRLMNEQMAEPLPGYPFYWLDPAQQSFVYGYDVYEEIKRHDRMGTGLL